MTDDVPVWRVPPGFSLLEETHVRTLERYNPAVKAKRRAQRAGVEGAHRKRSNRYWGRLEEE